MTSNLERATVEQAPLLRKLFCDLLEPLSQYNRASRDFELTLYTTERFAEIISDDADAIWIAYLANAPVGFSIVEPDRDLWWFSWIGVTKEARGHRLGHQLTANALQIARSRSVRKISCVTRPENTHSISILRGLGFERVCELTAHWFGEDYILWQIRP